MKRSILFAALVFLISSYRAHAEVEQKTNEDLCEQFADTDEKKEWCQKLADLKTEELKAMFSFFNLVLRDHSEKKNTILLNKKSTLLLEFSLNLHFRDVGRVLLQFPRACQQVQKLRGLIEQEKNMGNNPEGDEKSVKDALVVNYSEGCLACIEQELDERLRYGDEHSTNYVRSVESFEYFRK
jgi:hypothetical protein